MTVASRPPQLCFVVETAPGAIERCNAAMNAVQSATIIVAPASGESISSADAAAIVRLGQSRSIAVLIENDIDMAKSLDADGVHLAWTEDVASSYAAARAALGPNAIVGIDAGQSRHDAMSLGESGADYVAFGISSKAADRENAEQQCRDLVEWWAEVFEIPVVALGVETAEEAASLADAGADFIAARLPGNLTPDQTADVMSYISQALDARPTAA